MQFCNAHTANTQFDAVYIYCFESRNVAFVHLRIAHSSKIVSQMCTYAHCGVPHTREKSRVGCTHNDAVKQWHDALYFSFFFQFKYTMAFLLYEDTRDTHTHSTAQCVCAHKTKFNSHILISIAFRLLNQLVYRCF